ncbi:MAG: sulfotransferase [Methylococcales bacterium]
MKKFVLVGTQRSGTTFIRHCLNSHDDILCHGELFFKNYPHEEGYFKQKETLLAGGLRHLLFRSSMVRRYLDCYYSRVGYQAVGYKLMYAQTRWIPYSFPAALSYINDNALSVIHVIRENVLKTHLSREVARQRKVYHAQNKAEIKKIILDTGNLLNELNKIKAENIWWEKSFGNKDYLAISYESFVANKEKESKKILDFLDVVNNQDLVSSNVKITSDILSDVIENYADVVTCLKTSDFSYCLDSSNN